MSRFHSTALVLPLLLLVMPAFAGTVELAWDAVAGASGYRASYGTSTGQYTGVQDLGSATSGSLTGLNDCTTYYIAVKAYDSQGGISTVFSNEVSGWARPEVTSLTPAQVDQGDQLTLDIRGSNFAPGADLVYDIVGLPQDVQGNDLITLENVSVTSCNQIQALVTIEPTARGQRAMELGDFTVDFEVVNPDTVFGLGSDTIAVQFDELRTDINRSDATTTDRVDGKDLVWLAHSHASAEGDPFFNPDADLDGDGIVDGNDLAMLAARFGQCWTGSGWSNGACN